MKKTISKKLLMILCAIFVFVGAAVCLTTNHINTASATETTEITVAYIRKKSDGLHLINVTFAGFGGGSAYDSYNGADIYNYIKFNGRTIAQINSDYAATAAGWTCNTFPQNNSGTVYYLRPILNYCNGSTTMEMRIFSEVLNDLFANYGLIKITVCSGLTFGGYTLTQDADYLLKTDYTLVTYASASVNEISPSDVGVYADGWSHRYTEYYFNVYFAGFNDNSGTYAIMDKSAYYYKSNLIKINGVSAYSINANTDVSAYEWTGAEFPRTNGSAYQKPFLFQNDKTSAKMMIRMKEEWYDANNVAGSITLSFAPNVFITNESGAIYVLTDEVKFVHNGAGWIDTRSAAVVITESIANRPYSVSEKTWYFKVNFAGFTTVGYDAVNVAAVNDNILINGKSVTEINAEYATAAAGWTWSKFPQNAAAQYAKPVLNYVGDKGVMQMQLHENLYNALKAEYGLIDITVKDGFTFGGYTVGEDCAYVLNGSNVFVSFADSSINKVSKSSLTLDTWDLQGDLYYFYVNFAGFESTISYDVMEEDKTAYYYSNLIRVNGVSAKYINENTDVSGYSSWTVFPQSSDAKYRKPLLFYTETNGKMTVKIKNDWWNQNKYGNSIEVAVVPHVYITTSGGDIYCAEEEVVYLRNGAIAESVGSSSGWIERSTLTDVSASSLSIYVDNNSNRPYSQSEYTYYFKIGFSGFATTGQYDMYNTRNVTDYIEINGKTLTEITAETDVTGWTWGKFPQNADAKYQLPVLNYVSSAGVLQMQMHENYFFASQGVRIKVLKGLNMSGYILTEDKEMIFKEASDGSSSSIISESDITYVYPEDISVSRWQPLGDVIYFDINYPGFASGTNYKMMDEAAYYYIANLVYINGKSMRYWNLRTDVSGYSTWGTFPSTAGATYQKPFVTLISDGKMEVRMKLDWWNANKGDGNSIEISVVPGTFITKDDKLYGVKEAVTYVSDPDNSAYTTAGWFSEYGNLLKGASVRIAGDTSGIRFSAELNKAALDTLEAQGATVDYGILVTRDGSERELDVKAVNKYEEDGKIKFNAVIKNLKQSSYTKNFTARLYLDVEYAYGHEARIMLGSMTRNIEYVATAALGDYKDVEDDVYKYAITVGGETKYSRYSSGARAILIGYSSYYYEVDGTLYYYVNESNKFALKSYVSEVDDFFDDYADRYLYADSPDRMVSTVPGDASTTWKDWEATTISHIYSSDIATNEGANAGRIANVIVDKYGYVWESGLIGFFGQGWNLPNYFGRQDTSSAYVMDGWEFRAGRKNSSILAVDSGATGTFGACPNEWTVTSDASSFESATSNEDDGCFVSNAKSAASHITYSVNDNNNSNGNGLFVAQYTRFIEVKFRWAKKSGSLTGVNFIFKNGSGSTYTLDLSTWATTSIDLSGDTDWAHFYIPVFEHANWTGNIKEISLKINGSSFEGYVYLDYVRGCFDLRMADTNTSFINAGKSHFENTGDVAFLTANLQKYRMAMQFLISYMTTDGIIDLTHFAGHNGGQGFNNSIISTYWDVLSLAPNSSYVNALYYKALLDMAYIEDAVAANDISVGAATVKTTVSGSNITYSETASSLRAKAAVVKAAITADLNTSTKTGYFNNINATQGYFVDGYAGNTLVDFGSVAFNLIIIDTGIATDTQAEKILNWMSTTSGLYDYEFAPKTNTIDIGSQKVWAQTSLSYGSSVQNGGAILFVSYYDILARIKYYGSDNAFERLSAIIDWYNDVKTAYEASGDDPEDFYKEYYKTHSGTLQGNNTSGSLGLHAEFVENAMLLSVVPDGFIGLDTHYEGNTAVLTVNPSVPDAIGAWKMEDVRYLGVRFDIYASDSFVMIKNAMNIVSGAKDKSKISITLSYTGSTPTVYLNNNVITSGYTVDSVNKTITYTTTSFTDIILGVK